MDNKEKNSEDMLKNNKIPKTQKELRLWMEENCYNFRGYSISQNAISEGFGIEKSGEKFIWYYTDYNKKEYLKYFKSESDIVEYAFNQIKSDKWAKANCIGFGNSEIDSNQLAEILDNLKIEYFQDTIPFSDKPVFRTFVFGCDIKKVEFLKSKFYDHTL